MVDVVTIRPIDEFPIHAAIFDQNQSTLLPLLRDASGDDFSHSFFNKHVEHFAVHAVKRTTGQALTEAKRIHELVVHFKLLHAVNEANVAKVTDTLKENGKALKVVENFPFLAGGGMSSIISFAKSSWSAKSQNLQHESGGVIKAESLPELEALQAEVLQRLKIFNLITNFQISKSTNSGNVPH